MNSPEFHIRFDNCQNVNVDSLFIKSPADSPNTDGIHVENTINVTIHNTIISNGNFFHFFSFLLYISLKN